MPTTQDALESPAKATVPDDHLHAAGRRAYDALAPFYECYWGPAFVDDAVSMFNQFLAPHLPPSAHILDLCCGAGHFAAWAKSAGLQVTGVDVSQSMIGYAREKVSGSEFHVADMKSFRLSSDFSATVCFYNSINQVLTLEALRSTLGTVAQHIQPDGWFLFDVVLEEGYARSWHANELVTRDGVVCELTYQYDKHERLAICHVTVRDAAAKSGTGSYEFFQRPHSLPTLQKKLHQSGFDYVQVSSTGSLGPPDGRVAIMARRSRDSIQRLE